MNFDEAFKYSKDKEKKIFKDLTDEKIKKNINQIKKYGEKIEEIEDSKGLRIFFINTKEDVLDTLNLLKEYEKEILNNKE